MIDFDILKKFGTTKERLRQVCTAEVTKDEKGNLVGEEDAEHRERLECMIEDDIQQGVYFNLRNYHRFAAIDLAWDGNIVSRKIIPFMLYAQGKLAFENMPRMMKDCGCDDETIKRYCGTPDKDGKLDEQNISDLIQLPVNLIRSLVQRRAAAQISKFDTYPLLKYDTYSKSWEAQLRGDVLTQTVERISDSYGYRKDMEQNLRDMILYPFIVEFPRVSWDIQHQYRKTADRLGVEEYIVREGVPFVRPHPSRVAWDNSSALSEINTDTGPEWIMYWDVVRYGSIAKNTDYWNRSSISYTNSFHKELNLLGLPYFSIYYETDHPCTARDPFPLSEADPAQENDRAANVGLYSAEEDGEPVVITEYRKKLIPKDYGIGEYPYPVWVRFVVAGEKTVVHAEILPSLPACYYGYNQNDHRLFNIGFGHEVMPWQDAATRIQTQILASMNQSLLKLLLMDTQLLDEDQREAIGKILKGGQYTQRPIEVEVDFSQADEIRQNLDGIKLIEAQQNADISMQVRALVQLISLAERTLNFSPQEQGQPAPREISATEVLEIANTTNTVYEMISKGVVFGLSAKKQLIYEALVSLGEGGINVPVSQRYPREVIEKAGFRVADPDEVEAEIDSHLAFPQQQTVIGTTDKLQYHYLFNDREGSSRISDAKVLQNLTTLVQLLVTPELQQLIGSDKVIHVVSGIFRAAGVPIEVDLDPEAQTRARQQMQDEEAMASSLGQIAQGLQASLETGTENSRNIEQIMNTLQGLIGEIDRLEKGQTVADGPIQDISQIQQPENAEVPLQTMPMTQPPRLQGDPFEAI